LSKESEVLFVNGDVTVSWQRRLEHRKETGDGGFPRARRTAKERWFVCWKKESSVGEEEEEEESGLQEKVTL
jgi:hypothetical protein